MNTESAVCCKAFFVYFDAIIELGAGFKAYFDKHPDEYKDFPQCNDPGWYKRRQVKSREMFIGKKTETFSKLLNTMSIELDSAFLEAEYYLTAPGEGKIYEYKNDRYSIAFDFYIDPTDQIETCSIALSYPKEKEEEIISLIRILHDDSPSVEKRIFDGDLNSLNDEINKSYTNVFELNTNLFRKKNRFFDRFRYFKGSTPQIVMTVIKFVISLILLVMSLVSYFKSEIDEEALKTFYDDLGKQNLELFDFDE